MRMRTLGFTTDAGGRAAQQYHDDDRRCRDTRQESSATIGSIKFTMNSWHLGGPIMTVSAGSGIVPGSVNEVME